MNAAKVFRNVVAGVVIGATPLAATVAAVRPGSAVPAAASTAAVAQYDDERGMGVSWAALAVIALTIAVAIYFALDDDPDGEGAISLG